MMTNKIIEYALREDVEIYRENHGMKRSNRMTDICMTQVKEREAEIPKLMACLGERLAVLEKELDSLASRLVPVMSNEKVSGREGVTKVGKSYSCEIAKDLASALDIVDRTISRINSLQERLEV